MYACSLVSPVSNRDRLAYSLRVDLIDIRQSLCQHIARHFVSVLVPEFGGLASCTIHRGPGIGDGAGHDTSNRW